MQHCYLIVPEAFAQAYNGYRNGASVLVFTQTTDGRIALSLNAVNEFPELFEGVGQSDFQAVFLTAEDFPQPTSDPLFNH